LREISGAGLRTESVIGCLCCGRTAGRAGNAAAAAIGCGAHERGRCVDLGSAGDRGRDRDGRRWFRDRVYRTGIVRLEAAQGAPQKAERTVRASGETARGVAACYPPPCMGGSIPPRPAAGGGPRSAMVSVGGPTAMRVPVQACPRFWWQFGGGSNPPRPPLFQPERKLVDSMARTDLTPDHRLAAWLGVSVRWLHHEVESGCLPAVRAVASGKSGKPRYLFDLPHVVELLLERARRSPQGTDGAAT